MLLLRPNENDRAESLIPRVSTALGTMCGLPLGPQHAIVVCCVPVGTLLDFGVFTLSIAGDLNLENFKKETSSNLVFYLESCGCSRKCNRRGVKGERTSFYKVES